MSVLPQTVSLKNDVLFVGLSMSTVQVVWLKKSFRLSDHPALTLAAKQGPVLPIYVVEPEYWMLPDTSYRRPLLENQAVPNYRPTSPMGRSHCARLAGLTFGCGRC